MEVLKMSATEDKMKDLNQQWYHAVVTGLDVDPETFQLAQGSTSLGGYTSQEIWDFLDVIPPATVNNYYQPGGLNRFSNVYGGVINNLNSQTDDAMKKLLKDKYVKWTQYRQDESKDPKSGEYKEDYSDFQLVKFSKWARNNVDKDIQTSGETILKQVDIVSVAVDKWFSANGKYAYTATANSLQASLNAGVSKSIQMDSETESTSTSNTWAKGSMEISQGFFSTKVSADWEKLTNSIDKESIQIKADFKQFTVLPASPLSTNAGLIEELQDYSPWYESEALLLAKNHNDKKVWRDRVPSWSDVFGSNGSLKRVITGLAFVDGISITLKLKVDIEDKHKDEFAASIKGGYFPFFSAEGEGGWVHETNFKDNGEVTITSTSQLGNPNIIGFIVKPFDEVYS